MYSLNLESDFDFSSESAYAVLLGELVLSVFTSPGIGILQLTLCTLYPIHTIQLTLKIRATEWLLILNSHKVRLLLTANIMYTPPPTITFHKRSTLNCSIIFYCYFLFFNL